MQKRCERRPSPFTITAVSKIKHDPRQNGSQAYQQGGLLPLPPCQLELGGHVFARWLVYTQGCAPRLRLLGGD